MVATAPAGAMCYYYAMGEDAVLIDCGLNAHGLCEAAEKNGHKLRAVLLTHCHYDHICGLPALIEAYPHVPIYIHEDDLAGLNDADYNVSGLFGVTDFPTIPAVPFTDGEKLAFGNVQLTAIHTPGHTMGSSCFTDGMRIFSGDTLFCGGIGRADLPGGDHETLIASIHNKLMVLQSELSVLPGHGKGTTLFNESIFNPFLQV